MFFVNFGGDPVIITYIECAKELRSVGLSKRQHRGVDIVFN
jgi:hypothetical protein